MSWRTPGVSACKGSPMSITSSRNRHKHAVRPPCCWICGSPGWWNGWRVTSSTRRHRARCSDRACPCGSWTIYESDGYRHRGFTLAVVVAAVAAVVTSRTVASVAAEFECSRWSVRRWTNWVATLGESGSLASLCARLEPNRGPLRGSPSSALPRERAGAMLALLERLAEGFAARGVRLPQGKSGLSRVLADQLERFGSVFYLTVPSPPLHVEIRGLPP
jgi:hypothetical protein